MSIVKEYFGKLSDGREVSRYVLRNENGMAVAILDFGGVIQQLLVPDRNGRLGDVVCGYDDISSYENADGYQGALIGRFANRIRRGDLTLDGKSYQLTIMERKNHLHGGKCGFNSKMWEVTPEDGVEPALTLCCVSADGEEGYPGNLHVTVTYKLTANNGLSIRYVATTDQKTILNLTNHAYFNLGGFASGKILDHELWMDADTYLTTDEELIPTGEIVPVDGTPFDFRAAKPIGRDMFAKDKDIATGNGYDHCFNFAGGATAEPVHRATFYDPKSGREMKMFTNQPCVQIYAATVMNNQNYPFKGGCAQVPHSAVCFETQCMPDSVHHKNFTNVELSVGEVYDRTTEFIFSAK